MKNKWNEFLKLLKRYKKFLILGIVVIVGLYATYFITDFFSDKNLEEISYNEFLQLVEEDKIDTIYYSSSDEYMTVTLYNQDTKGMTKEERKDYSYSDKDKRRVLYPGSQGFREDMLKNDINLVIKRSNNLFQTISSLILTLALYGLCFAFIMRMMVPGGRIREKDLVQKTDVTFDDIIGHEEIIDDIKFITELIKNPDKGKEVGVKLPKGILFEGPPGTGKTLLAKAIANEANVPFLYQNASGLIEMYVGLGAKRVRGVFKIARKLAPCIIFLDEIDAVGTQRGKAKNSSENEQTINALLQEMDGFNGREGVFIIAATNRADSLDEALVRSGRFDRRITVNPPKNWQVRRDMFEYYLKKFKVSDTVNIELLAKQTPSFTGADISMVCNEASIIAVMHDKNEIDTPCIEEAIDKKIFNGNRSKTALPDDDRNIVAYHEAGHAVVTYLLGEPIARASIQSTTSGVGGVVFGADTDAVFESRKSFKTAVLIGYGGRVSEEIKFGSDNITNGASNDITKATNTILSYIGKMGFNKDFGLLDIEVLIEKHLIDGKELCKQSSQMSKELYEECKKLLIDNYNKVEIVAQKLLETETLTGEEIAELLK